MELGSFAELLSGFGSIVALVFAAIAVRAAGRTNDQQGRQLLRLEEAEAAEESRPSSETRPRSRSGAV